MGISREMLEALGREVEAGHFVRRTTFILSLILTALVSGIGGYMLAGSSGSNTTKVEVAPGQAKITEANPAQLKEIMEVEAKLVSDPDNVVLLNKLGHAYFDSKMPPKAITAYEKSLSIAPNDPDILTDLGVMYREIHEHQKALEVFQKASAIDPGHKQSRFNIGIVYYFDLGQKDKAITEWRALLVIDPEFPAPNGQKLKDMINDL